MRILFLSRWFPYPANNGSKLRIAGVLQQLAREHEVDLLSFVQPDAQTDETAARAVCSRVQAVPYRGFRRSSVRSLVGLLTPRPRFLVDTYSATFADLVRAWTQDGHYDAIVASQIDMAPYVEQVSGIPAILDELEVGIYLDAMREGASRQRARAMLTWLKLRTYLRRTLPRFASCTVVSERERQNVAQAAPAYAPQVSVVPNGVDLANCASVQTEVHPGTLIFAGALSYAPNLDGLQFFLTDILPRVLREIPEMHLRVTGSLLGVDLAAVPGSPAVEYTGYLDDVRPVIASSWASVVPLRKGGGTRLKILESMALGTPVIATRKGAEGLNITSGEHALLADGPAEFAHCILQLAQAPELRRRLAENGRALVAERYDWQVIGPMLLRLLEQAAGNSSQIASVREHT